MFFFSCHQCATMLHSRQAVLIPVRSLPSLMPGHKGRRAAQGGGDDPATDVFLYSKAHLRASGVPLQPEALPPLEVPGAAMSSDLRLLWRGLYSSRELPQLQMPST